MPPQKAVRSLAELSHAAWSSVVHSSCRVIQDATPQHGDFEKSTGDAVQKLQNYLCVNFPAIMWERLFYDVMEIQHMQKQVEERIILSTFNHERVKVRKLTLGDKEVIAWLLRHSRMLTNVLELDVKEVTNDLIPDICSWCVNLQIITLPSELSDDDVMEAVIRSCPKLRVIQCEEYRGAKTELALQLLVDLESIDWPINAQLFSMLNADRKLKLRTLNLNKVLLAPEHFNMVVQQCPQLAELSLDMKNVPETRTAILVALAESSMKLSKVSFTWFDMTSVAFEPFWACRGFHLTDLTLFCSTMHNNPLEVVRNISENCPNLCKLKLMVCFEYWSEYQTTELTLTEQMSFPSLQHLTIVDCTLNVWGIVTAFHVMSYATQLTTFTLYLHTPDRVLIDQDMFHSLLMQLFDDQQVKVLAHVQLWCPQFELSLRLVQHIFVTCVKMTKLQIGTLSQEAKDYIKNELRIETKLRNFDFKCDMPLQFHMSLCGILTIQE